MTFLRTTLLGGLFILLPILLLWLGSSEIAELLVAMATPIADMIPFPPGVFDNLSAPGVVATLLIIGTSFALGFAASSAPIANIGRSFETSVLFKVPMYRMLKIISSAVLDTENSSVSPAILIGSDGASDPCYLMEQHADGRATVLVPWSPASFAGSVRVVPAEKLQILSCSLDEFSRAISFMGVGVEDCIRQDNGSNSTVN